MFSSKGDVNGKWDVITDSWMPAPGFWYRSASNAGSFCFRYRIVEKQRRINQMEKIQPSGQVKSPERRMMSAGNTRMYRKAKAIFFSMRTVLEVRRFLCLSRTGAL